MSITRVMAEGFRNLQSVDYRPGEGLNLISGDNGSGKTSLLEVIYTLATGRSFRTRRFKNLIGYESPGFQLFGELEAQGLVRRLGVGRAKDGTSVFKLDGQPVASAGELAVVLPCQVVNSQSFSLVEGGPGERRAFLDWLVFHVKPEFRLAWREYARALKHRNALLRLNAPRVDLEPWDAALSDYGEEIDQLRERLISDVVPACRDYLRDCGFVETGDLDIRYQAGWDRSRSLAHRLSDSYDRDLALGYTSIGPHKSDIRITFNKRGVADLFSRGQQKAFIASLYLAQLRVFKQRLGDTDCVLLLDDLPAELDNEHIRLICHWLQELPKTQVFVTGINLNPILDLWPKGIVSPKMFHVKHGHLQELPSVERT